MNLIELVLILAPLLVFNAYAEDLPDYYNPYAPIFTDKEVYTWTDKIGITIVAPSWDANKYGIDSIGTQEGHLIKISSADITLEPYKLTETETSSGIFTGEVTLTGFLHDVAGILVKAIETSENSGLFEASISFTQSETSSGNRLFAMPDDSLQAKYDDHTLPSPYSISDNLEISSESKFVSNIPPIERISIVNSVN